jgi:phage baseplate assembly protein V
MAGKNLLADTDYTRGTDNRFKNAVLIGRVSEIDCTSEHANIRAIIPDKVDHNGQPLITKPIPVLQICAGKKRSFAMPRVGQNVLLVKLPTGTSDYAAIGFFYTKSDPPPVTDPMLDYCIYDDGSTVQFSASDGTLTWNFKGGINITTQKDVDITVQGGAKVNITADGDVNIISNSGQATIQAATINLKGNIVHTGDITTSGVHTDSLGHHS